MKRVWRVSGLLPFTTLGIGSYAAFVRLSLMGEGAFARSVPGRLLTAVLWPLMLPAYVSGLFTMPLLERILSLIRPAGFWTWWVLLPFRLLCFASVDGVIALGRWYAARLFPRASFRTRGGA